MLASEVGDHTVLLSCVLGDWEGMGWLGWLYSITLLGTLAWYKLPIQKSIVYSGFLG